eukprot:TRINITY_DN11717_c0_g1_i1.p1 TRINITY_DN11717_c0_g1~~TRINITY_DN11717_c0_g1_i1.p1  ORF type:complete len:409 (+),score=124.84 TRINITY_DN11717_c0_g1_i1:55-1281(+)
MAGRWALRAAGVTAAGAAGVCLLPEQQRFDVHSLVADELTAASRRWLDAETAHNLAIRAAALRLTPRAPAPDTVLATRVMGLDFESPVGLAAGFDKNAEAVQGLEDLGFGFVEVGTITPVGQEGNPKPRMFRLEDDFGVINRYGFNNEGADAALPRVMEPHRRILGVNVGKNKATAEADAVTDYAKCIHKLGAYADYLVVNVSSPNTPGLRDLQRKDVLEGLLASLVKVRDSVKAGTPLLVKIAPDVTPTELGDIASAALAAKIDGVIVSNTTISRPHFLTSSEKAEAGGLSGLPVRALSTKTVYAMAAATKGALPIVGVGGVATGQDAFDKIVSGASLVQLYSMMAYEGPSVVHRVNTELAALLRQHGFKSPAEAVGAAHRNPALLPKDLTQEDEAYRAVFSFDETK